MNFGNIFKLILLILILLSSYLSKAKEIKITKVYELNNIHIEQRDTTLYIKLKIPYISIGDSNYIVNKRNIYSSVDEYIIYDEFTTKQAIITFQYNPDTGDILTVKYEGLRILYYRP